MIKLVVVIFLFFPFTLIYGQEKNICFEKQILELKDQIDILKTELEKQIAINYENTLLIKELSSEIKDHRIREDFFSSILGNQTNWWMGLIAVLGIIFGFISFSRINDVKDNVKNQLSLFKDSVNSNLKFNSEILNKKMIKINGYISEYLIHACNSYYGLAIIFFKQKQLVSAYYTCVYSMEQFREDYYNFYNDELKNKVIRNKNVFSQRLKLLEDILDELKKIRINKSNSELIKTSSKNLKLNYCIKDEELEYSLSKLYCDTLDYLEENDMDK